MTAEFRDAFPPPAERRTAGRSRALLTGKIVFRDGSGSFDCAIRNISRSGAQILVEKAYVVPTRAYLIDMRKAVAYQTVVAWIRPPRYGLKFGGVILLNALADPELEFLKRLWLLGRKPLSS
jgi:PilZ domain